MPVDLSRLAAQNFQMANMLRQGQQAELKNNLLLRDYRMKEEQKTYDRTRNAQQDALAQQKQGDARKKAFLDLTTDMVPDIETQMDWDVYRNAAVDQFGEEADKAIPREMNPKYIDSVRRTLGTKKSDYTMEGTRYSGETNEPIVVGKEKWGAAKAGLQDGKPVYFQSSDRGNVKVFDESLKIQPPKEGGLVLYDPANPGQVLLDTTGGAGIPNTKKGIEEELKSVRDQKQTMFNLVDTSQSIIDSIKESSSSIGAVGWTQRKLDSVLSQVQALTDTLPKINVKIDGANPKARLEKIKSEFDWGTLSDNATEAAIIKSRMMELSYLVARMMEPNARQFSDADIKRSLTQIGADTGSSKQMAGVMRDLQLRNIRKFNRSHLDTRAIPYTPTGLSEDTIQYGMDEKGLPREEIILRHILRSK